MKALLLLISLSVVSGCGQSAADQLAEARDALTNAAYEDAAAAADAGLASLAGGDADGTVAWGLELARLEAHARLGDGVRTKELLAQLGTSHPDRIPPTQYSATAHQLKIAGDRAAAIEVLDLGAKRFPSDPLIAKMIGDSGAGSDPAELEMLRSLGYIE